MKPSAKLVAALVRTLRVAGLVLAFTLFIGGGARFHDTIRGHLRAGAADNARATLSNPVTPEPPKLSNFRSVTRYLMGFAGDRSLDVATVVEQVRTGYTRYTVQLELSSGADQSIAVMAPPGGLRPEVLDMTGDGVRNDLVLTPMLLHWPLTVLVNDGHDHFEVAISATSPGSLGSGEDRASGKRDVQSDAVLMSSGFRADCLTSGGRPFLPRLQENIFSPIAQAATVRLGHTSSSERAPPRV
jgi:hypothetical protein